MSTLEQIDAAISRLPKKAQLKVVESLNARLFPTRFASEVEEAWSQTVKRRVEELESGQVKGVSASQVFARSMRMLASL